MITLNKNNITVDEYLYLRERVNWNKLSIEQAEKAIHNSLFFVKAVSEDGNVVGMGRIVGDGAVICYIQDLVVLPEVQHQGVGSLIISELKQFVDSLRQENTTMMLGLMCAKGREPFYEKHGFIARPTDSLGPGMIMYLS